MVHNGFHYQDIFNDYSYAFDSLYGKFFLVKGIARQLYRILR